MLYHMSHISFSITPYHVLRMQNRNTMYNGEPRTRWLLHPSSYLLSPCSFPLCSLRFIILLPVKENNDSSLPHGMECVVEIAAYLCYMLTT